MRILLLSLFIATLALVTTAATEHDLVNAAHAGQKSTRDRSHDRNDTTARIIQSSTKLSPRSLVQYDKFVQKGKNLLDMLAKPANSNPQSRWVRYADLEECGWTLQSKEFDYENTGRVFMTESMEQIFKAYSLSKDPHQNLETVWTNSKTVKVDGHEYLPSGGIYTDVLTPKLIFATNNYAPWHMAQQQKPVVLDHQITPLRHWSDVVFLEWQQFCGHDSERMKQLLGIVRDDIQNADTNEVVYEAMKARDPGGKPDTRMFDHGTWFEMTEEGGQAILGTQLGSSVAFFLAQHRGQLGMLTVRRVKVYRPNDYMDKALLFEFGPVEVRQ